MGKTGSISVIRLIFHNCNKSELSSEQNKVLTKLHKITVIGVQSITTTLSLDTCRETTPEDVAFKETDDKFTVFVSRTSSQGKFMNVLICRELSRIIEVDMMTVFTCITHPAEEVNQLFEINSIAEIPIDDGHDRSWLQGTIQPNLPVTPMPIVTEKSLAPAPPPSSPPRSPTALSVHDEEHFPPLGTKPTRNLRHAPSPSPSISSFQQPSSNARQRQRSMARDSVGVSRFSQFAQSPQTSYNSGPLQPAGLANAMRDMNRLAIPVEAFVNGGQMQMMPGNSLAGPVWPPFADFNAPVSTEETDMVGIMGEHFVRCIPFYTIFRLTEDKKNTFLPLLKRYTKNFFACWMTLALTTGQASYASKFQASHCSEAEPVQTSHTWTVRDSSRGRGLGPRRRRHGMVVGPGTTLRSSRRAEKRTNRSI